MLTHHTATKVEHFLPQVDVEKAPQKWLNSCPKKVVGWPHNGGLVHPPESTQVAEHPLLVGLATKSGWWTCSPTSMSTKVAEHPLWPLPPTSLRLVAGSHTFKDCATSLEMLWCTQCKPLLVTARVRFCCSSSDSHSLSPRFSTAVFVSGFGEKEKPGGNQAFGVVQRKHPMFAGFAGVVWREPQTETNILCGPPMLTTGDPKFAHPTKGNSIFCSSGSFVGCMLVRNTTFCDTKAGHPCHGVDILKPFAVFCVLSSRFPTSSRVSGHSFSKPQKLHPWCQSSWALGLEQTFLDLNKFGAFDHKHRCLTASLLFCC